MPLLCKIKIQFSGLAEYKDAFKKFDKGNKGEIGSKDVAPLMKATKSIPTDKEIQEIVLQAGVEGMDKRAVTNKPLL